LHQYLLFRIYFPFYSTLHFTHREKNLGKKIRKTTPQSAKART